MPLTPIDVQQKTFGTALRGYDLDEVDDFLDEVVTSLKDYEQRLRDAQERISTLEVEMTDRGDTEGAIARALVAAQRSADSIIADARAEADRIIADAQTEASEVAKARDSEKAEAEAEIARVRGIVGELRQRLAVLSEAVGAKLDDAEDAVDDATAELDAPDEPDVEPPVPAWEEPAMGAVEDDDESEDDEDDDYDEEDEYDDDMDDDEAPVRPWEVG